MLSSILVRAYEGIPATNVVSPFVAGKTFFDISTIIIVMVFFIFTYTILSRKNKQNKRKSAEIQKELELERNTLEKKISNITSKLIELKKYQAEDIQRAIQFGELSKGLFHDLMNPLTSISMYVERLNDTKSSNLYDQEIITKALNSSRRMKDYMDNIKKCLRNSEADNNLRANVFDELNTVKDLVSYKARLANITININCPDNINLTIQPVRLHQLFLNLITNSIESFEETNSKQRQNLINISIKQTDSNTEMIFEDNGKGMNNEELFKIFKQRFTTKQNGTGMGTNIIKKIVEDELGGKISVDSKLGSYTIFTIIIPNLQTLSKTALFV